MKGKKQCQQEVSNIEDFSSIASITDVSATKHSHAHFPYSGSVNSRGAVTAADVTETGRIKQMLLVTL